jgi:HlyB family type I secretion system ABC transporter
MVATPTRSESILEKVLSQFLSAQELATCLRHITILEPSAGQKFWTTEQSSHQSGLYLILEGKARMVDPADNLVMSLEVGTVLGGTELFPDQLCLPFEIRASYGLKLGHLDLDIAQSLLHQSTSFADQVQHQAAVRDVMLHLHQHEMCQGIPRQKLLQYSSQIKAQALTPGNPPQWKLTAEEFWLLRKGELALASGSVLQTGTLYRIDQTTLSGSVQILQETELYRFSRAEFETLRTKSISHSSPSAETIAGKNNLIATVSRPPTLPQPVQQAESRPQSAPGQKWIGKAYFPTPGVVVRHWWQHSTRQYPFLKQQSKSDCGVACLAMVGLYWGKRFSINQLRHLANVDRRGASLKGLMGAAESLGFAPRPMKGNLQGLAKQPLPAIALWEGKHYVVVYAVTRRHVVLADPAIGRLRLTHAEFEKDWSGYTLFLQPTYLLKKSPEAKQDFWSFFELVKPYWVVLLEVLLTSLLIQVFGLCSPLLTQVLLDRVVVERSVSTFFAAGSGVILLAVFSILMRSLRRYLLFHTANRIDLSLGVGFVAHALRLPQYYFDSRYVGDITSRIQENRTIRRFMSGDALLTLIDLLMVVVYLGLMFWYSPPLALMAVVLMPLLALVTFITTPFLKRISREVFNAKTTEGSYLIEALTGVGTIKALGIERLVRWRWEELFNQSIRTNFSGQVIRERLNLVSDLIQSIGVKLLFLVGVWLVIHEQLTIGQLFAFNMLLGNVFGPFERLISLWNDFQEVLISIERINDVLESQPEENPQILLPPLPPVQGHITFEQVTFRYNPDSDRNTLENFTFQMRPGQMIALVGRSGSGKTTLAKLLLGLYPVSSGRILVDGYDINTIAKTSLRQQVGLVDQNTFLFGGTIRENIAVAHSNATLTDIRTAAKLAGAAEFIEDFPLKYETPIGEGGSLLSGGQRQRIAIARALLGNPRILIFDEATSSLDTESERIIQNNLTQILKNRTTLVIAHRLSTIKNADCILVMDRGVLVEQGTHDALMAKRGHYFYLNQQQLTVVT